MSFPIQPIPHPLTLETKHLSRYGFSQSIQAPSLLANHLRSTSMAQRDCVYFAGASAATLSLPGIGLTKDVDKNSPIEFERFQGFSSPRFTHADLEVLKTKQREGRLSKQERWKLRFYTPGLIWEYFKIVPIQSQLQILGYLANPLGLAKDLLAPPKVNGHKPTGYYLQKIITMAGAPFVKYAQTFAQVTRSAVEVGEEEGIDVKTMAQELGSDKDKKSKNRLVDIGFYFSSAAQGLYNRVPTINPTQTRKKIMSLAAHYNTTVSSPERQLNLNKPFTLLGSGSVAQTFVGELQNGQKVILKVIRPEVDRKYLDKYKEILFRLNLIREGTSPESKKSGYENALAAYTTLSDEINPTQEKYFTDTIAQGYQTLGVQDIRFPKVFVANDLGLVEEFIDGNTWGDLSPEQKATQRHQLFPTLLGSLLLPSHTLDMQPGNVMLGKDTTQVYMIDLGRSYEINPTDHSRYLDFLSAYYSEPRDPKNGLIIAPSDRLKKTLQNLFLEPIPPDTLDKMIQGLDLKGYTSKGPLPDTPRNMGYNTLTILFELADHYKLPLAIRGKNLTTNQLRTQSLYQFSIAFPNLRFNAPLKMAPDKNQPPLDSDAAMVQRLLKTKPKVLAKWIQQLEGSKWFSPKNDPISNFLASQKGESEDTSTREALLRKLAELGQRDVQNYKKLLETLLGVSNQSLGTMTLEKIIPPSREELKKAFEAIKGNPLLNALMPLPDTLPANFKIPDAFLSEDLLQQYQSFLPQGFTLPKSKVQTETLILPPEDIDWIKRSLIALARFDVFTEPYITIAAQKLLAHNIQGKKPPSPSDLKKSQEQLAWNLKTHWAYSLLHGQEATPKPPANGPQDPSATIPKTATP